VSFIHITMKRSF